MTGAETPFTIEFDLVVATASGDVHVVFGHGVADSTATTVLAVTALELLEVA